MKKIILALILILSMPIFSQSDPTQSLQSTMGSESKDLILNEGEIALITNPGGIYEVMIKLNDVLDIPFVLDTGASESSMPLFVLNTLIKTNTVVKSDRLSDKKYIMADGSTVDARRVLIKRLRIGDYVVENIAFSISDDVNSPLLLGQNVLSEFKEVKIDYKRSTLTLTLE